MVAIIIFSSTGRRICCCCCWSLRSLSRWVKRRRGSCAAASASAAASTVGRRRACAHDFCKRRPRRASVLPCGNEGQAGRPPGGTYRYARGAARPVLSRRRLHTSPSCTVRTGNVPPSWTYFRRSPPRSNVVLLIDRAGWIARPLRRRSCAVPRTCAAVVRCSPVVCTYPTLCY